MFHQNLTAPTVSARLVQFWIISTIAETISLLVHKVSTSSHLPLQGQALGHQHSNALFAFSPFVMLITRQMLGKEENSSADKKMGSLVIKMDKYSCAKQEMYDMRPNTHPSAVRFPRVSLSNALASVTVPAK